MTKEQILRLAAGLPPIEEIEHRFIGCGDDSVACENGPDRVLLVTHFRVAEKIELLRTIIKSDNKGAAFFDIPILKSVNVDLAKLIHPTNTAKAQAVKSLKVNNKAIWKENFVYEMPRYKGTLEDLGKFDYDEKIIAVLEEYLDRAVQFLHSKKLTHNDISPRNVFISGEFTKVRFHLGDWGSLTQNTEKSHNEKTTKDLRTITRTIDLVAKYFKNKPTSVQYTAKPKMIFSEKIGNKTTGLKKLSKENDDITNPYLNRSPIKLRNRSRSA